MLFVCFLPMFVQSFAPFTCQGCMSLKVLRNVWNQNLSRLLSCGCFFSFYSDNPMSLFLSPSCLPWSGITQSQSLTSVHIVPSLLPTLATWPNTSVSTPGWNPTPAPTVKSASDSSVTFSNTTGKWITGLGFLTCLCVPLQSGEITLKVMSEWMYMYAFACVFIQDSHRRSTIQVLPSRLWEILHAALKFTGVENFRFPVGQCMSCLCYFLNTKLCCDTILASFFCQ